MSQKESNIAVRINSDYPALGPVEVKTSEGVAVKYMLLSIPFYLIGQLHRFIEIAEIKH